MILSTNHIKKEVEEYFKTKPVNKVWLFGSYARGDADADSDVDVLVDIDYAAQSGTDYFLWFQELGDRLRKKVDVVSKKYVNNRLRPFIEKDMFLLYEKGTAI